MQIAHHVEELQRQLLTAAAAGGPEAQDVAHRLVAALDPAARLAVLEALSDAAGEITRELAPGSVDVRLRGRDVEFVVARPPADTAPTSPGARDEAAAETKELGDGATSRTTLRLPDALKSRADAAAAAAGMSLNAWFVRAVGDALEPPRPPAPSRGGSYRGWLR